MKDHNRRLFFILFCFFISFVLCIIAYNIWEKVPYLITPFEKGYRINGIILLFIKYIPIVQISAILICYTISFAKYSESALQKSSTFMRSWKKRFLLFCAVFLFFYTVLSEVVKPDLLKKQKRLEQLSASYFEYMAKAVKAMQSGLYISANDYSSKALNIWKNSEAAQTLKDQASLALEKTGAQKNNLKPKNNLAVSEKLTAETCLTIAESRISLEDFFTANRYAELAERLAGENDTIKRNAAGIQKKCMENIRRGGDLSLINKTQKEFAEKKKAYEAFKIGNYIKAYYSFFKIQNDTLEKNKYDPDIEKFLKASKEKLLTQIFFIEEFDNVPNFDSARSVKFKIFSKEETKSLAIGGMYFSNSKNKNNIYLSDLVYSEYQYNGTQDFELKIPYAKISENGTDGGKKNLKLQITGMSYENEFETITPIITAGIYPYNIYREIDLPITMKELNLVLNAVNGSSLMTITELYAFRDICEKFGFDKNIYSMEIFIRLAEKFLFLILSIMAVIIAFEFRQPYKSRFKINFVFFLPLFPYAAYWAVKGAEYFFEIISVFCMRFFPDFLNEAGLGILTVLLLIMILILYSRKGKPVV